MNHKNSGSVIELLRAAGQYDGLNAGIPFQRIGSKRQADAVQEF
jgi:hypothetical protein